MRLIRFPTGLPAGRLARIAVASALGLAALCSAQTGTLSAQGLQKIVITQPVASFSFLPLDYAKAAGYFEAEGLEVQQVATRGGGPDIAALVSGDVQFNAAPATQQISVIRAGRDIVNVYNFYSRSLLDVVISTAAAQRVGVSPQAPLKERAAALKGLTLAMTRPGAITHSQLQHLERVGGLAEGDIKMVAIGDSPSMISALARGQIDGFTISIPGGRIAVGRGEAVLWVNNAAGDDPAVDPMMFQSIFTYRQYAKEHPQVVRGLIKALKRAVEDIATKPDDEVRRMVQPIYGQVEPKTMLLAIAAVRPALNRTGGITLEMARKTLLLEAAKDVTPQQLLAAYTAEYQ